MNRKLPLFILLIMLYSCSKKYAEATLPKIKKMPSGSYVSLSVAINTDEQGYAIPETFLGLSYETGILTNKPDFLNENNTVLLNLIKNLGSGILRIGGGTSDQIKWIGNADNNTNKNLLTAADVDRLAEFSKAVRWPVIFGLNLGNYSTADAADEAAYVFHRLKRNLYAFQSGNEPDVLNTGKRPQRYNCTNYMQAWEAYLSAIRKDVPRARFAGPDVTPFNNNWIASFTKNEYKNIDLIDGHYYVTGPASVTTISYSTILKQNPQLINYVAALSTTASQYHLPYRITECNSIFGGGKKGVSDVFASSLWALDFMWIVAENKGQGINFHGGDLVYTPIASEKGTFIAKPVYYAMLAFNYAARSAKIVPVTLSAKKYNIGVHACAIGGNRYSITLINKEIKNGILFTIQLKDKVHSVKFARLRSTAITSSDSTSFAGSKIGADGVFKPNITEQYRVDQTSFDVYVPAASAMIVNIQ